MDGSPYGLSAADDSDSTLYGRAASAGTCREMTGIQDERVSARLNADLAGLVHGAVVAR